MASVSRFADRRLLVTGVQIDELRRTPSARRRAELLAKVEEIDPSSVPASSFCFGIDGAGFGQATWNDGTGNFDKMLALLQGLDAKSKYKKRKDKKRLNQLRDILIAETAIQRGATLISHDHNLREVVSQFGGSAVDLRSL